MLPSFIYILCYVYFHKLVTSLQCGVSVHLVASKHAPKTTNKKRIEKYGHSAVEVRPSVEILSFCKRQTIVALEETRPCNGESRLSRFATDSRLV